MTTLFGAAQGVAAIKSEALSIHKAKAPKFYLKREGQYLHQSGLHMQSGSRWAWQGTAEQARACRRDLPAAVGCVAVAADLTPLPVEAS